MNVYLKNNLIKVLKFALVIFSVGCFCMPTFAETKEDLTKIYATREEFTDWGASLYPTLDNLETNMQKRVQKEVRYQMFCRWMDYMFKDTPKDELDEFRARFQREYPDRSIPFDGIISDYYIEFDSLGGQIGTEEKLTVTKRTYQDITPPTATKDGRNFMGWYVDKNYSVKYEGNTDLTMHSGVTKTVYAKWEYTIKFDLNGHTGSAPSDITKTEFITRKITGTPTVEGYDFGGWYEESACTNKYEGTSDLTADSSAIALVYAKLDEHTFTIDYELNGGSFASGYTEPTSSKYFDVATLPVSGEVVRNNYTFAGWYDNASFTGTSYTSLTKIYNEKKLYAKWTYTIVYNQNGRSATMPSNITKSYGVNATLSNPTNIPTGYLFGGWYKESGCSNRYYGNTDLTPNSSGYTTIYAKWTPVTYTIYYNANGGSVSPTSVTKTYSTNVTLATPTYTGQDFLGWYKESSFANRYYGTEDLSTTQGSGVTIYAKWQESTYTVNYNLNGGSWSSYTPTTSAKYSQAVSMPVFGNMTRSGYKFRGWFDNSSFSGSRIDSVQYCTGTKQVYAKWEALTNWSGVSLTDWMAKIPDDMYLNEINLPGTHDTGCRNMLAETSAYETFIDLEDRATTQSLYMDEQMNVGTRVFDLRINYLGNLCHGSHDQDPWSMMCSCLEANGTKFNINEAFDYGRTFLQSHPTETLVYIVTYESGSGSNSEVIPFVKTAISNHPASGNYKGVWNVFSSSSWHWPQLSEVRGKIVVVDDFSNNTSGSNGLNGNIPCKWMKGSTYNNVKCYYQNDYDLTASNKWSKLQTVFSDLANQKINTTIGVKSSTGGYIYTSTQRVVFDFSGMPWDWEITIDDPSNLNSKIKDLTFTQGSNYGMVLFNFIDEECCRKIIATNP